MRAKSRAVETLSTLARSDNLRRVELAWGASTTAESAHFVARGADRRQQRLVDAREPRDARRTARRGRARHRGRPGNRLRRRWRNARRRRGAAPTRERRGPHPDDRRVGAAPRALDGRFPDRRETAEATADRRADDGAGLRSRLPERAD